MIPCCILERQSADPFGGHTSSFTTHRVSQHHPQLEAQNPSGETRVFSSSSHGSQHFFKKKEKTINRNYFK